MLQKNNSQRFITVFSIAYAILSVAVALYFLQLLFSRALLERIPFDTDEADHALAGLEMFTAFSNFDLPHIWRAFVEQAFYPPLHSLVVALSYAVAEPSLASSRTPSVILLGIQLILIALATFSILRGKTMPSRLIASAAALLAGATCYTALTNSVLCMLEPLGLALVALLMLLVAGFNSERTSKKQLFIASCTVVLVCLSKYSFGIIVAPALPLAILFTKTGSLAERLRNSIIAGVIIAIGLAGWLLVTDWYAAWRFISGHPSSGPVLSVENFLYYPRAWYQHYAASSPASLLIIVFAAIGVIYNWRLLAVRLAFFIFLLGSIALTISTTDEIRHFLVVTPGVWLLTGIGIVTLGSASAAKVQERFGMALSSLLLMLVLAGMWNRNTRIQKDLNREFEGLSVFAQLHEYIAANVDARKPILVSGMFDQFGNQALLWTLAKANFMSYRDIQLDSYPFREETKIRARERKRNMPYPWRVENFPRSPLPAVLAQKHYASAILLRHDTHRRFRTPEAFEFRQTLEGLPQVRRKTHGWSVVIYQLQQ